MTPDSSLTADAAASDVLEPEEFRRIGTAVEDAVSTQLIGQREAIRGAFICLATGGHALLEGVPGLGKTTMARLFAAALELQSKRIQFTPDLMPADITGTTVLMQDGDDPSQTRLQFEPGPLFTNIVLADEINRAAPRTQSALLEAMQEHTVTIANTTHRLPEPFFVLATQNPVEMYGTYPLPEAELDRFFMHLRFDFPPLDELNLMASSTVALEQPTIEPVADGETILRMRALVRTVPAASNVIDYASRLVLALHPNTPTASEQVRRYVRLGPSPRGVQALTLAGRVLTLMADRYSLAIDDIREIALPALRHRLVLTFDAERQAISADDLIEEALALLPREA